jgi:hypothetical protein
MYEICTRSVDFGMRHARVASHDACMDVVAVLIAVAFAALLLLLIKGIDRI